MTNPNFPDEEEKPLDPEMEKIRRKMVRLLIVSSSVIVVALMAVLGSIVYKVKTNSAAEAPKPDWRELVTPVPALTQNIKLPADFVLESTSISGDRILMSGASSEGRQRLFVYDIGTGKLVATIAIEQQ